MTIPLASWASLAALLLAPDSAQAARAAPIPSLAQAPEPAPDAEAQLVSQMSAGQTDPGTGVTVIRSYRAASGRECREYSVGRERQLNLACAGRAGWFRAPPLTLSAGVGASAANANAAPR